VYVTGDQVLGVCEELVGKGTSSPSFRRRAIMMTFEGWNEEEGKLVYSVVETLLFSLPLIYLH
jgi:hypothetical protein